MREQQKGEKKGRRTKVGFKVYGGRKSEEQTFGVGEARGGGGTRGKRGCKAERQGGDPGTGKVEKQKEWRANRRAIKKKKSGESKKTANRQTPVHFCLVNLKNTGSLLHNKMPKRQKHRGALCGNQDPSGVWRKN